MKHDEILGNRAEPAEAEGRTVENDCCSGELVFALQDNHHQFSLGLTTVLQCLKFAEAQGYLPPLPGEWWGSVRGRYHVPIDLIE